MNTLRETARQKSDKQPAPSVVIIDSPTVKTASFAARDKGIDGNKKVNGRKRHIAVDTNGYPVAVYVGAAHRHDGEAGLELLALSDKQGLERLTAIRADSAYQGVFVNRQHILLGRQIPHKPLLRPIKSLYRKKIDGRQKEPLPGSTFFADYQRIMRKRRHPQRLLSSWHYLL